MLKNLDPALISVASSALVAIVTVIASVFTTLVTTRNARKMKSMELFFSQKTAAFEAVVSKCAKYPQFPTNHERQDLLNAVASASLFCSEKTRDKIATYAQSVIENSYSDEAISKMTAACSAAVDAMRSEIGIYEK